MEDKTTFLLNEPAPPSRISESDRLSQENSRNHNQNHTTAKDARTSFIEGADDTVNSPQAENGDVRDLGRRQAHSGRREEIMDVAAPGLGQVSEQKLVIPAKRDSGKRGTSPGDENAITYVIEGAGTVKTLNRLTLENGGDTNADGRPVAMAHCHVTAKDTGMDKKARFRLLLASVLCMIFMIGECVGGVLAHSLAVVSDAAHLLTDFASFMISLMALYLASRPATKRLSFGWHRAEILGALVSILMLWVITGILAYSAVLRIESGDYEIDATIMLITSATGVVFNIILGCTLHQHGHSHGGGGGHGHSHSAPPAPPSSSTSPHPDHHTTLAMEVPDNSPLITEGPAQAGYGSISGQQQQTVEKSVGKGKGDGGKKKKKKKDSNINVKAAFIHVLGDFTQSVGVLIAAIIIFFKPEWKIADPICTFLFSALVLITTITILRDILVVLMEGTPRNINFEEVRDSILNMEGVKDLHDLRVWSLTMDKTALSVHLAVERGLDPMQVVQATSRLIQQKYNITQTTIQVEEYVEEMRDCTQCQDLKD